MLLSLNIYSVAEMYFVADMITAAPAQQLSALMLPTPLLLLGFILQLLGGGRLVLVLVLWVTFMVIRSVLVAVELRERSKAKWTQRARATPRHATRAAGAGSGDGVFHWRTA